jgi:hypothetical protein
MTSRPRQPARVSQPLGNIRTGLAATVICPTPSGPLPPGTRLHDGRARNLTEAIRWHGGEGQSAKNAFVGLSASDRTALLRFIQTL